MTSRARPPGDTKFLVATVLLVAQACVKATDVPVDNSPTSGAFVETVGSRLAVRWFETPEGARVPAGAPPIWYDKKLRMPCVFHTAADGKLRCLPEEGPRGLIDDRSGDGFYADAACTMPAVGDNGSQGPYATLGDWYACNRRQRMFWLGEQLVNGVYEKTTEPTGPPCTRSQSMEKWYGLGAEIPPTNFVRATEVAPAPPSGDGSVVDLVIFETEDGGKFASGWHNFQSRTDCVQRTGLDGRQRCLPTSRPDRLAMAGLREASEEVRSGTNRLFSDSTCQRPVLELPRCADRPTFVSTRPPGSCYSSGAEFWTVGDVATTVFGLGGMTACSDYGPGDVVSEYAEGTRVPDDTFPELKVTTEQTPGARLRRYLIAGPGGQTLVDTWMYDSGRKESCLPLRFGDYLRCVPGSDVADLDKFDYFADPKCTRPIVDIVRPTCAPHKYVFVWDSAYDTTIKAVYSTSGQPYDGPMFAIDSGSGACQPHAGLLFPAYTGTQMAESAFEVLKAHNPE